MFTAVGGFISAGTTKPTGWTTNSVGIVSAGTIKTPNGTTTNSVGIVSANGK